MDTLGILTPGVLGIHGAARLQVVSARSRQKNHFLTYSPHLTTFSVPINAPVPIRMPNFVWHLESIIATR